MMVLLYILNFESIEPSQICVIKYEKCVRPICGWQLWEVWIFITKTDDRFLFVKILKNMTVRYYIIAVYRRLYA